ncbi:hypothetical protein CBR_g48899 [Chara braunii]|uniref:Right handed beta helix domain-containing protein n=1 Tax=Chara braunii TaxID=69332 RepID=A0A388M3X9_CHABU|nr:hypothetical protein CBR_g48899 [Chara braunii]|eukprot:GBG89192.1 hypothetical protein CBR_g48899 [Chara braunii]
MAGEFPVIGHEMVIEGKGNATLDAAEWEFRPFVVRGRGAKLTLKNLQLYKGQAPLKSSRAAKRFPPLADGGSVLVYDGASLEMHNVFVNHSKSWRGAAIAAYGASKVTVVGCRFLNNYAWYAGGGIYLAEGSNASVFNCSFERNKGSEEGGAIAVTGGSYLRSERTTYRRNTGKREGGAGIMVEHPGSVVISIDDLFFENKGVLPSAVGGAILVRDNGTLFVSGSRFVRNRARGGKGNTIFVEEGGIIGRLTNGPTEKDVEWPSNQPKPDMPMGMTTETENNAMATEAMATEMETMEKKAMAMESTTTIGSQSLPPPPLLTGRKLRWSLDMKAKESANEPAKELTVDKGAKLMMTPDSQPLPPLPGLP